MDSRKWGKFFRIFSGVIALASVGFAFSIAFGLMAPLPPAVLSVIVLLLCAVATINVMQEV